MIGKVVVRERRSLFSYKETAKDRLHRLAIQERLSEVFGDLAVMSQSDAVRAAMAFAFSRRADFLRWVKAFRAEIDADADS